MMMQREQAKEIRSWHHEAIDADYARACKFEREKLTMIFYILAK